MSYSMFYLLGVNACGFVFPHKSLSSEIGRVFKNFVE